MSDTIQTAAYYTASKQIGKVKQGVVFSPVCLSMQQLNNYLGIGVT